MKAQFLPPPVYYFSRNRFKIHVKIDCLDILVKTGRFLSISQSFVVEKRNIFTQSLQFAKGYSAFRLLRAYLLKISSLSVTNEQFFQ